MQLKFIHEKVSSSIKLSMETDDFSSEYNFHSFANLKHLRLIKVTNFDRIIDFEVKILVSLAFEQSPKKMFALDGKVVKVHSPKLRFNSNQHSQRRACCENCSQEGKSIFLCLQKRRDGDVFQLFFYPTLRTLESINAGKKLFISFHIKKNHCEMKKRRLKIFPLNPACYDNGEEHSMLPTNLLLHVLLSWMKRVFVVAK